MIWKIIFLCIFLIGIDQASKFFVMHHTYEKSEKWIQIQQVENTGMAFGIHKGNTKNIVLTAIVLVIVIRFIKNQKDYIDSASFISLSLILAGGIGNLIDRLIRGAVIDFIYVKNFSVFNVADCYIVIGWVGLVIAIFHFNRKIVGGKTCEKP